MVDFNDLYALQQRLASPMLNIQVAQAQAPRPLGAPAPFNNAPTSTSLLLDQMYRFSDIRAAQAQQDIENERARAVADLQMQQFQAELAQQQAEAAALQQQTQARETLATQFEDPMQQAAVRAGLEEQVVSAALKPEEQPKLYNVGGRLINELGSVVYEPEGGMGALESKDRANLANTLRDDFRADTKSFDVISNYWDSFKSAGKTGVGDVTRIFAYMKMIDPTSTVREGEAATLEQAGGVPAGIVRLYNRVVGGGSLSPQIREQLTAEAGNIYNSRLESYQDAATRYRGIAGTYGIPQTEVVPEREYEKYGIEGATETPEPPPGFVRD